MINEVIARFDELYPDKTVVDNLDEFTRIKEAGKVELLREIKQFVEEEYGQKMKKGVSNG